MGSSQDGVVSSRMPAGPRRFESTPSPIAQPIPRPANGHNVARILGIVAQPLPERGEMSLHGSALDARGIAPHFAQQLRSAHHSTPMPYQRRQQVELLGTQAEHQAAEPHDPRGELDAQLADRYRRGWPRASSAALEQGSHPGRYRSEEHTSELQSR